MADFVLCPTCRNPIPAGESCPVCNPAPQAAYTPPQQGYVPPQQGFASPTGAEQYNSLYQAPPAPQNADHEEYERLMQKTYAPMGAWSIFGTFLLFSLPFVGNIIAIIFACGACKKKQKASLARGYLLYLAALCLLVTVLAVVLIVLGITSAEIFSDPSLLDPTIPPPSIF